MRNRNRFHTFVCMAMTFLLCFGTLPLSNTVSFAQGADTNVTRTDTVLVSNNFEDRTTQGWISNSSVISATYSSIMYHTGNGSLLFPEKKESWNAPTYDLLSQVKSGDTIGFSAYLYQNSGTDKTFQITANYVINGNENWLQFAGTQGTTVSNGHWTKIEGTLVIPQGNLSKFTVYPEYSGIATDGFYMDDVQIIRAAAVQSTGVVLSNDFEDGTNQGWSTNNSDIQPTVSTVSAHSGGKSLLYPKKVNTWDSPTYDLRSKVKNGDKLKLTAWVYYDSDTNATKTFQFTIDQVVNGVESWAQFEGTQGVTVPKGQWTKMEGTYVVPTAGAISKFTVYPEYTSPGKEGFYLDDVEIVNEGAAPNGISSDFEDRTAQGWYTQGSEGATVSPAIGQGHTGNYSLLTTGRQVFYDRPTFELKDMLIKGKTYKYTAWVKFNGEGANGTRKFSMFTTKKDAEHATGEYVSPTGAYGITAQSGQWTKVEGILPFDYSGTLSSYSLYVEITNENPYSPEYTEKTAITDFYIDDITVAEVDPNAPASIQTDIPDFYKQFEFPVGAAMEPYQLDDSLHAQLLAKHFNSLVAENAMKFGSIEPQENTFDFSGADKLVDFAIAHNMKVRGHNLVWYMGMPDWVFKHTDGTPLDSNNPDDKQLLLDRLKNHITKTIKHFDEKYGVYGEPGSKNPIYCWDVVNEPINDTDGGYRGNNDPWYRILGEEYIIKAFEYAHKANPNIKLFLNEYSLENRVKNQGIYNLAKKLVEKGVPIDGIGNQLHINLDTPSIEEMRAVIDQYAELGLEYQVTELDITTQGHKDENTLTKQGYRYKALFEMFKEEAAKGKLTGVTFWGLADDHNYQNTLIPDSTPLLFDEKLQAKPAYWGIVDPGKLKVFIQTASVPQGSPTLANASIDSVWYTVPGVLNSNHTVQGSKVPTNIKLMWDTNYLYVLAEVKDSTISDKDGIEIFIDRNNSKNTSYEVDDSHYSVGRSGVSGDGIKAVSNQTSDGYMVQTQIPMSSVTPVQGKSIGFDVRINDYSINGTEKNVATWNDSSNSMDTDTSNFGILSLDKPTKFMKAVKGTPVMDGKIDIIWQNANEISTDKVESGVNSAKATVKTLWDSNYLYVLADVTDPVLDKSGINPWEQDSVEFFIDQNNAKTVAYQSDDAQYRVNFDNETSINGGDKQRFVSAASRTDHGYLVEAAIPINDAYIGSGRVIGFDVQVNDATGGSRTGVSTWSDTSGTSYKDTSVFGNIQLVDPAVTNPTTTSPTTSTANFSGVKDSENIKVKEGTISVQKLSADTTTHEAKVTLPSDGARRYGNSIYYSHLVFCSVASCGNPADQHEQRGIQQIRFRLSNTYVSIL
ncbi:endo-1,4-beta-xylanase [Paenibacillus farraposensis]|uniref:Beta-xylanase n=2 Tax=Paenibacillus farraposensis TaxID=2807095 RepID=A0ABW4DJA3_9BACL|nr:endo-1,4-beta-xylanase [Paenibacillus farraposensis]MCC3378196.1 endo-1,4-beta-xylanase [Paenibacillus farraposensis]